MSQSPSRDNVWRSSRARGGTPPRSSINHSGFTRSTKFAPSGTPSPKKNEIMNVLSVARSGGFGDDGDSLKSSAIQDKYWSHIAPQIPPLLSPSPQSTRAEEKTSLLINIRKLREGIHSSKRCDIFSKMITSTSLFLALLFDAERDLDACMTNVLESSEDGNALLVCLLVSLALGVYRFQSAVKPRRSELSSLLGHERFTWLLDVSSSLNQRNYYRLSTLLDVVPPPSLDLQLQAMSISSSLTSPPPDLPKLATERAVTRVKKYASNQIAWPTINAAYRELHLQMESETRRWVSQSLSLPETKVSLEDWLSEMQASGKIKAKTDIEGRWMILKTR
ncbi:hypothetical protein DL96DRAFT_1712020 [Flagelloscypha sp. PMI_526]|nr:hypothetical protein DL96DRAFT_1712020 [Flagelloscypha sp. PMI_526]